MQDMQTFLLQLRANGYNDKGDKGNIDENGVRLFSGVRVQNLEQTTTNSNNSNSDNDIVVENANTAKPQLSEKSDRVNVLAAEPAFVSALDSYLLSHTAQLLVLGPCTDVAYYLNHTSASVYNKISEIFVAGGAFSVNGNAHYNFPSSNIKA